MGEATRGSGRLVTQQTPIHPARPVKEGGTFANGALPTVADRYERTRHQAAAQLGIVEPGPGDVFQFIPFSSGSDGEEIQAEIYGVREVEDGSEDEDSSILRSPILLARLTITLGTRDVNGGTAIGSWCPASAKYAKSITIDENVGLPPNQVRVMNPTTAAKGVASVVVDLMGCAYAMIGMKSGASDRACNALYTSF